MTDKINKNISAEDVDLSEEEMATLFEQAVGDHLLAMIMDDGYIDAGEINLVLGRMGFSPQESTDAMLITKVHDMIQQAWESNLGNAENLALEEKQTLAKNTAHEVTHSFTADILAEKLRSDSPSILGK